MKKQTNIRKVASISLAFLMAGLHGTSAMEDGMREQEKGNDPSDSLRIHHAIPETPKAMASLTHQIRAEVERVLEAFQNNMNAYYARTRNPKRITVTTVSNEKISENLEPTLEETAIATPTATVIKMIGTPSETAERIHGLMEMYSQSGDSAFSEKHRSILRKIKTEREERLQNIMGAPGQVWCFKWVQTPSWKGKAHPPGIESWAYGGNNMG